MFSQRGQGERKEESVIGVAIDRDKGSQYALKWAVDHLLSKGQTVTLIHVSSRPQSAANSSGPSADGKDESQRIQQTEAQKREMFLPFRCFCTRKDIQCNDVILEDTDVAKAIIEYISQAVIDTLVIGASTRSAFLRFKTLDIPTCVSKGAPDFCSVYIISKGKITSVRAAARPAPVIASRPHSQPSIRSDMAAMDPSLPARASLGDHRAAARSMPEELETMKSPFTSRGYIGNSTVRSYGEMTSESDISFVSAGRPSTDRGRPSGGFFDHVDSNRTPRLSNGSDVIDGRNFDYMRSPFRGPDPNSYATENTSLPQETGVSASWSAQTLDDVEAEMKRLKLELKQTMDMYSTACKEALSAKQKARELHRWKMEEEQRLEEAKLAEEAARAIAEKEKAKCKVAMEAAEAAQRIAELEAQKRINAEMKAVKESEEKKKALDALANNDVRYRKYTIEEIEMATEFFAENRKIGEGGYGPVYRCSLDHTPVAIKVLRPDAAQGRSQFQQEVEVLSCIRHPNMVLLLGACPEYGCLVYEHMANGSLEDRLFRRGNSPVLPWQLRFRIASEIGTALLFLHQTKPEPLVHRDLKPANILLDRNFVSKISDVGLARLVPPNVADSVTQYRMTSTAGTFCYIDPEYQQTGMLGIKSDIYSLGIMLLQIITAKPPMGLTHHVDRAIERGNFNDMLDPAVLDWPVEEALAFAKTALRCSELRRKDRPDLGTVVLPELNRLRRMAEESWEQNLLMMGGRPSFAALASPSSSSSSTQDVMSGDSANGPPGYSSSTGRR